MPEISPTGGIHPIAFRTSVGLLNLWTVQSAAAGVWGYVGLEVTAPKQDSTPSINCGVLGQYAGNGIAGSTGAGVVGIGEGFVGIHGKRDTQNAVLGESDATDAVVGSTQGNGKAGVLGLSPNGNAVVGLSDHGTGVFGQGGQWAGSFVGRVLVQGDIQVTGDINLVNADCAENFDISGEEIEPGTVMAIGNDGSLEVSREPYNKRVAGVISGARNLKPGIVLGKGESEGRKAPLALLGKVYCKVDATDSPIEVGDLLTTAATPGHAMKAAEGDRAAGAVIGKALQPLQDGQGMIPILIALQ